MKNRTVERMAHNYCDIRGSNRVEGDRPRGGGDARPDGNPKQSGIRSTEGTGLGRPRGSSSWRGVGNGDVGRRSVRNIEAMKDAVRTAQTNGIRVAASCVGTKDC